MGAILADAINLGLDRMAESSRGLTIHQLNLVADRHIRPETYGAALAAVVDAQHAQPFAVVWGPGSTSSSDGQFFPAGGCGEAASDYNARQGSEPGSVVHGFISDRFASCYLRVIAAAASEAPDGLDGLMHHESAVEIHQHATDTAGAVDSIFPLAHAFGYRLRPAHPRSRRAQAPRGRPRHGRRAARRRVRRRDQPRRHRGELARGAPARRLHPCRHRAALGHPQEARGFPRHNALHRALREMGRLERAIFTRDWLLDPELRRRSNGNLNKGESRHALARAVFFHRLGELRDRTAEDMAHRASGLNLVVNAIVLWNTTYLARAVAYVRDQGVAAHGRGAVARRPGPVGPHRAHRRLSLVGRADPARAPPALAHEPVQARDVPGFTGCLAYTAAETPTHPHQGRGLRLPSRRPWLNACMDDRRSARV